MPDYPQALARVPRADPQDLARLVRLAALPLGATDVTIYLVDFERVVLQPLLLALEDDIVPEEDVGASAAGQAFRTGELVVSPRAGGVQVWAPLVERGERTGVVALQLPQADEETLAHCVGLGIFTGLLVRSFSRFTDLVHLRRRRRAMTLAAGLQWDLLPPLTVRGERVMACGLLEPAYEIAGDVFDYVVNDRFLDLCLFDGMGHGLRSALLATLAVGSYRHARRAGEPPDAAYTQMDETLASEFADEEFATGILGRLHYKTGVLEWVNAGHPSPLLMRNGAVVKELNCVPSLPFGLGGGRCEELAAEPLGPDDEVLFYTDGVVETRAADGEELGVAGLVDLWERETASGLPPEEVLRRMCRGVVGYGASKLRDDATFMLVHWYGPRGDSRTTS